MIALFYFVGSENPCIYSVPNRKQSYEDIIRLFAGLPETYRAVLEMKFLLDCSGKDISQKLGISENAVNVRISRGRAMLREIMEKEALHL